MRRPGILLAAALVLAADAFVLVKAALNRAGAPVETIELTERELRLVRPQRESTALFLRLAWEPAPGRFKFEDGPGWFNQAKLEELGYDCRLPLADPSAPAHYGAMPAREAFAVLEYNQAALGDGNEGRSLWSRLLAVDVGRDLALLRKKYPDTRRFLIVPSLVSLIYQAKWDPNLRRYAPGAFLRGSIGQMLVSEISVPPSERRVLESLRQTTYDYFTTPEARARGPRYSVVLYYGRNHEPWIGSCRLIAAVRIAPAA
jgi:hypothetical protein